MDAPIPDRKRLAALYVSYPTFESLFKSSSFIARSRNWFCPRCEKINLECLPDPSPGGPSFETVTPASLETNSGVEVARAVGGQVLDTAATDLFPSPSPQDPPAEHLPTTVPIIPQTTVTTSSPLGDPRPPLLLDTAICVLLVLALALLFRRFT